MAIGFIHPIAVGLNLVFAVGFATAAIAGERQRGTLEVLLSRPISRRVLYATLAIVAARCSSAIAVFGSIVGSLVGAGLTGRTAELGVGQLPMAVAQRRPAVLDDRRDRPARLGLVRPAVARRSA